MKLFLFIRKKREDEAKKNREQNRKYEKNLFVFMAHKIDKQKYGFQCRISEEIGRRLKSTEKMLVKNLCPEKRFVFLHSF